MSISKYVPFAITVGILAAIWIAIGMKLQLVLWVPFISWALFFGAGAGKFSRVPKEIVALIGGTIAGVLVVLLLPTFSSWFGFWGLPVLVFLAGFSIVMLELTNLFELAPAYFFSFAGFFAYLFGGFAGTAEINLQMILMFVGLLLVGIVLASMTAFMRKVIFDILKVPEEERQTIFDKERKRVSL